MLKNFCKKHLLAIIIILTAIAIVYSYLLSKYGYSGSLGIYSAVLVMVFLLGSTIVVSLIKDMKTKKIKFKNLSRNDIVVGIIGCLLIILSCWQLGNVAKDYIKGPQESYLYDCEFSKTQKLGTISFPSYHLGGYDEDGDFRYYRIGEDIYEERKGEFHLKAKITEWKNTGVIIDFELID